MAAAGASVQYKTRCKDVWVAKVQYGARGQAAVNFKYKSERKQWLGFAMLVPLTTLLFERLGIIQ